MDGAHAADGQRFQNGDAATARLFVFIHRQAVGAFPPLVILSEQVQGLPGRQGCQGRPDIL